MGLVLAGVLVLIMVAGLGFGVWYFLLRDTSEPTPVAEALTPVPVETLYPSLATETPSASAAPTITGDAFPPSNAGTLTMALEATEHVWVRVTRDGQVAYSGLMDPGQVETWSTTNKIVLETGNAAGLLLTLNDQQQGSLGARGEAVARAWSPSGETAP
jgi:hypothetical protein